MYTKDFTKDQNDFNRIPALLRGQQPRLFFVLQLFQQMAPGAQSHNWKDNTKVSVSFHTSSTSHLFNTFNP